MSGRNRPGPAVRLGSALAAAVLRGAPRAETEGIAKRLLEKEAERAKRREEERLGTAANHAFRRS